MCLKCSIDSAKLFLVVSENKSTRSFVKWEKLRVTLCFPCFLEQIREAESKRLYCLLTFPAEKYILVQWSREKGQTELIWLNFVVFHLFITNSRDTFLNVYVSVIMLHSIPHQFITLSRSSELLFLFSQIKSAKTEKEAEQLLLRSLQYLERYIYLILFNTYLHLEKKDSWQRSFTQWMLQVVSPPPYFRCLCLSQLNYDIKIYIINFQGNGLKMISIRGSNLASCTCHLDRKCFACF